MNETQKAELTKVFDDVLAKSLASQVGPMVAENMKSYIEKMRIDRTIFGRDISGLSEKVKLDFVEVARAAATKDFSAVTKANEALVEEQDNRGGYLVSREVADAILRIAASVGTIMSQAQKWTLVTDELGIPNYTGSFLTGAYLGVDVAGTVTGLTFGQAALIAKKWQLAFAVGNDLLADASVNLADWLLAIAGESLANMVDQQGFAGVGAPFVGILANSNVTTYTLSAGKTKFSNTNATTPDGFEVILDGSNMIANLEESILDGAAFYCHRTVWAAWRAQKDSSGNYILPFGGLPAVGNGASALEMYPTGGPIRPAGTLLGFPVYTNRWMTALPAANAALISTKFAIFGNMRAIAFGDRGEMRVAQFESGSFGGKEVALADQRGIVYKHRHGLVIALPAAFVVAATPAA